MGRKRACYDAWFKLKVVKYAEECGSNRKAGDHFGVNEKQVRSWRNSQDQLTTIKKNRKRCDYVTPRTSSVVLEDQLMRWIKEKRQNGHAVSGKLVQMQARQLSMSEDGSATPASQATNSCGPGTFNASNGWLDRFKRRHCLSTRASTSLGQKLPPNHQEKMDEFRKLVIDLHKEYEYQSSDIFNMDEMPLCFDMPSDHSLAPTGSETVLIQTNGMDKWGFTTILTVAADGSKLKPYLIFKGKHALKINMKGVVCEVQEKGYVDEGHCLTWIQRSFPLLHPRPRMLVWDSCWVHLTPAIRQSLKRRNIQVAVIPSGLTHLLQPLDVLNMPFKANMRAKWEHWMVNGTQDLTKEGNCRVPSRDLLAEWSVEAWQQIPAEMVVKSFLKLGLSNKMYGTDDDAIWTVGIPGPGPHDHSSATEMAEMAAVPRTAASYTATDMEEDDENLKDIISVIVPRGDNEKDEGSGEPQEYLTDDLKELHRKLMLLTGNAESGKDDVVDFVEVNHTELGIISDIAEDHLSLTVPENIQDAREQAAMPSTIDGIMLHPEMSGLSIKIEPTNEDSVIPMQLEEVQIEEDDAKFNKFYNSLQHQEGFKSEGEAISEQCVSVGYFDKYESIAQPDAPDEDCVASPHTVRNNFSIKTECDEGNIFNLPQEFEIVFQMEETKASCVKFGSSSQFGSDNDHQDETGESLVNCPRPRQAITKVNDDPQRAAVSILRRPSAVGEHCMEPPHTCYICGKGFKTVAIMTSHVTQYHLGKQIFKCYVCGKDFFKKSMFDKHMLTHVEKCGVCGKKFAWLSLHMLTHTGERPHRCRVCAKVFVARRNSSSSCTNLISPNREGLYDCDICRKKVRTWQHFTLHIKEHALTQPHLTCVCSAAHGSSSDTPTLMTSTQEGSHKRDPKSTLCGKGLAADDPSHCSGTGKSSSVGKDSVRDEPGDCVVCGKYIRTKGYMSAHLLTHTGELPFKCDVCGNFFRHKTTLSRHMLNHSEYQHPHQQTHKCGVCGEKLFTQTGDLKHHMLIHNMEQNHLSKDLLADYVHNNDTSNHVPINSERHNKSERCGKEFCQKEFREQPIMRKVLIIHRVNQNVRPVGIVDNGPIDKSFVSLKHNEGQAISDLSNDQNKCSFCVNGFQSPFELHLHLLTHFKGRPEDCDACVQGFTSPETLLKHLINHIESSMYDSSPYVIGVMKKKQSVISDKRKSVIITKNAALLAITAVSNVFTQAL